MNSEAIRTKAASAMEKTAPQAPAVRTGFSSKLNAIGLLLPVVVLFGQSEYTRP